MRRRRGRPVAGSRLRARGSDRARAAGGGRAVQSDVSAQRLLQAQSRRVLLVRRRRRRRRGDRVGERERSLERPRAARAARLAQHPVAGHARRHGLGGRRRWPACRVLARHPDHRPREGAARARGIPGRKRAEARGARPPGRPPRRRQGAARLLGRARATGRRARPSAGSAAELRQHVRPFVPVRARPLPPCSRDRERRSRRRYRARAGILGRVRAARRRRMSEVPGWALGTFLTLLIAQRLSELVISKRNARGLLARGAREFGAGHYPWLVLVHVLYPLLLAGEVLWLGARPGPLWPLWLLLCLVAQALRFATIRALGDRWNTRILVVPGEPLVQTGPYRWLRHPNYLAVAVELPAGALLFGA